MDEMNNINTAVVQCMDERTETRTAGVTQSGIEAV